LPIGDRWRLKHVAVKTVFVYIMNGWLTVLFLVLNVRKHNFWPLLKLYKRYLLREDIRDLYFVHL